jgi:hypothetical protein
MATADLADSNDDAQALVLYHGTDRASADEILNHGLDRAKAAAFNASGEFWATTDAATADVFAYANPHSPPAARLEFGIANDVLQGLLSASPPRAHEYSRHGVTNYEFLPASFTILNQAMAKVRVFYLP